jgi:hypothetical protein
MFTAEQSVVTVIIVLDEAAAQAKPSQTELTD